MRLARYAALFLIVPAILAAQKREITPADYQTWKSIAGSTLSNDGKWVAYTISPEIGEGELVVRSTTGSTEYRSPRGYIARPNFRPSGFSGFGAGRVVFSADSRFLVFSIEAPQDSVEAARKAKKAPADQPKSTMAIMDLSNGKIDKVLGAKGYRVPDEGPSIVIYSPDEPAGAAPTGDKKRPKKTPGATLAIRDLATGSEVRIADVGSYVVDDSGKVIVYNVSTRDGGGDGVFSRSLAGSVYSQATTPLMTGDARYDGLTLDRSGKQIAFVSDKGEYPAEKARYALYSGRVDGGVKAVVPAADVPSTLTMASSGVSFTRDGQGVYFNMSTLPPDTAATDMDEKAVFDLWHYKDPVIQPAQEKSPQRTVSYSAIAWPASNKWVKLGNDSIYNVHLSEMSTNGLAVSPAAHIVDGMWGDAKLDVFVVNGMTGDWKLIKANADPSGGDVPSPGGGGGGGDFQMSPGGKFVMMFQNNAWSAYEVATGKTVNLTGATAAAQKISFHNETDDHPARHPAWGIAGWTEGDDRVLIEDRFDIWEFDPTGKAAPKNVTGGAGRKDHIQFRIARAGFFAGPFLRFGPGADVEGPYLKSDQELVLRATNEDNFDTGYWKTRLGASAAPEKVVMMAKNFSLQSKAKHAEQYLATEQTLTEFPELETGTSITSLNKISNVGALNADFKRGTEQLITYSTVDKKNRYKALVYKPEGFDPSKKYPMIVYHYELLTNGFHSYISPRAGSDNLAAYLSRGYVVLQPDIHYVDGHPGESAYQCLVGSTKAMIDSGYIDPKAIGLAGHSWGGYQGLYVSTRTDIFRAITPGAPVANMTSAYGGIRWGAGINRSMQYERTQSRIGGTPWDSTALYIENSPLFHLNKVHTPLLIIHNDNDGAVPWYQGIELFIGLRRLHKEAYLFNYNGDEHGPTKTANALDWDIRISQFFDHYLKGAPAPNWMEKGIPYVKKGTDQVVPVFTKAASSAGAAKP